MPVLDKLSTIVEWDIDTSELERYEVLVGQAEGATNSLSGAVANADAEVSALDSAALEALSADVEIASGSFEGLENTAESAAAGVDSAAGAADGAASALGGVAAEAENAASGLDGAAGGADNFGSELSSLSSEIGGTLSGLAKMGAAVVGIFTGVGTAAASQTAQQIRLAEAVGMTAKSYYQWGEVAGEIGMDAARIGDLINTGAKKFGQLEGLGEMKKAQDSLKMLGVEFENINKLSPDEQFRAVMSAAKDLENSDIAKAGVMGLYGTEAAKLAGHLRNMEGSLDQILDESDRFIMVTERGLAGAKKLKEFTGDVGAFAQTGLVEVMGRVTEKMQPMIDRLSDWVEVNKELIDQKIEDVADGLATALRWIAWGAEKIVALVEALGGAGNTIKSIALAFGAWKIQTWVVALSSLVAKMSASAVAAGAMKTAVAGLKSLGMAGLFGAAFLAVEDLYYFLTGGNSAIGRFMDEKLPAAEKAVLSFFGIINDDMTLDEQRYATAVWQDNFLTAVYSIQDAFSSFFGAIGSVAGPVFEALTGDFTRLNDLGVSIVTTIENALTSAAQAISEFFGSMIDGAFAKFFDFVHKVRETARSIPILGGLVDDGDVVGAGVPKFKSPSGLPGGIDVGGNRSAGVPKFGPAVVPMPTDRVSPVAGRKGDKGGIVSNSTVNAPITIHAAAGADAKEIARAVSKELKFAFADVKTSGIKR